MREVSFTHLQLRQRYVSAAFQIQELFPGTAPAEVGPGSSDGAQAALGGDPSAEDMTPWHRCQPGTQLQFLVATVSPLGEECSMIMGVNEASP